MIIQVSISFNTKVSIDDVINSYSEPTKELVISSYKNRNNNNNSKSVENNIAECDIDTTVFIVDDTSKIKDFEKIMKEDQTGKAVDLCKDVNILFISHSAIDAERNLNNSKLHLNTKGSRNLQESFVKYLIGFSS